MKKRTRRKRRRKERKKRMRRRVTLSIASRSSALRGRKGARRVSPRQIEDMMNERI